MIDIAMNNGDLIATDFGDIALVNSEIDDIIQTANNNIQTIKGEIIFHSEIGNDAYNRRLKMAESGLRIVEECCVDCITNGDSRIADVVSISAVIGDEYGECDITYKLLTTDGTFIDSSISINIF